MQPCIPCGFIIDIRVRIWWYMNVIKSTKQECNALKINLYYRSGVVEFLIEFIWSAWMHSLWRKDGTIIGCEQARCMWDTTKQENCTYAKSQLVDWSRLLSPVRIWSLSHIAICNVCECFTLIFCDSIHHVTDNFNLEIASKRSQMAISNRRVYTRTIW